METQSLEVNVDAAKFALKNNLHVEYFIFLFLRMQQSSSGKVSRNDLYSKFICKNTVFNHCNDNLFFNFDSINKKFYLKSIRKLPFSKDKIYIVDFQMLTPLSYRLTTKTYNSVKMWNSTTIKYFFICVVACQYEDQKPYALDLIEKDIKISMSTIQRALKTFDVKRKHGFQDKYSPRGFRTKEGPIYLTPNFYFMPIGQFFRKDRRKTRCI